MKVSKKALKKQDARIWKGLAEQNERARQRVLTIDAFREEEQKRSESGVEIGEIMGWED